MAHGVPGSPSTHETALLRPLRDVMPMGWMGGKYSTSNPMPAMYGSHFSQSLKVPWRSGIGEHERGNTSYQALNRAFFRSAVALSTGEKVVACVLSAWREAVRSNLSLSAVFSAVFRREPAFFRVSAEVLSSLASSAEALLAAFSSSSAPIWRSTVVFCPASILLDSLVRHVLKASIHA